MFIRIINTNGQAEWLNPSKVIKVYTVQEGIVVIVLPEGIHIRCTESEWLNLKDEVM